MSNYVLNESGAPVEEPDIMKWAEWFEGSDQKRVVAIDPFDGGKVSTVFLGIDHAFGRGAPILFETMVFGGEHDQFQDRYSTREEALAGHAVAVKLVTG